MSVNRLEANLVADRIKEFYGVSVSQLKSPSRISEVARARHAFCAILHYQGYGLSELGRMLGGRDHSTIAHSVAMGQKLPLNEIMRGVK